ncbi:hypothetical protein HanPI659440_Chr13g0488581 [Helianthus annuus]|nr:hypothetical protein HanPI659440_Chr13g0488581 [Helianthus annuus]
MLRHSSAPTCLPILRTRLSSNIRTDEAVDAVVGVVTETITITTMELSEIMEEVAMAAPLVKCITILPTLGGSFECLTVSVPNSARGLAHSLAQ